jgi:hypothetical protein
MKNAHILAAKLLKLSPTFLIPRSTLEGIVLLRNTPIGLPVAMVLEYLVHLYPSIVLFL